MNLKIVYQYILSQVELYSGVFTNIDESASKLVCGPQAGLVLLADKLKVTVMTGSGEQLSAWKWNNPPQVFNVFYDILKFGA